MDRKKIIIGNWKMNPASSGEAERLFTSVAKLISASRGAEIVVCPPAIYLPKLKKISKKIVLGVQDASADNSVGAFTGDISAEMLGNMGAKYVILGHSERRSRGETDEVVNRKIKAALSAGLRPILCVGELERDENHEYFKVVQSQVAECLSGISKNLISKVVVAYEPVWAISSTPARRDATPENLREMAIFIRKIISNIWSSTIRLPRVIYGGSVNEKDAEEFISAQVDGLLVGRASLDPKKFAAIVKICEALNK